MKTAGPHLSWGTIAALAKSKAMSRIKAEYQQHLGECAACARNFAEMNAWLNTPPPELSDKVFQFLNTPDCCETDENVNKAVSVLTSFLNTDLSEQSSLQLYAHLNECYCCFEMFARNWNDFLTTHEKIKGES